jgi:hypothetical protein
MKKKAFAKIIGWYTSHLEKPARADTEYCKQGHVVECEEHTAMIQLQWPGLLMVI